MAPCLPIHLILEGTLTITKKLLLPHTMRHQLELCSSGWLGLGGAFLAACFPLRPPSVKVKLQQQRQWKGECTKPRGAAEQSEAPAKATGGGAVGATTVPSTWMQGHGRPVVPSTWRSRGTVAGSSPPSSAGLAKHQQLSTCGQWWSKPKSLGALAGAVLAKAMPYPCPSHRVGSAWEGTAAILRTSRALQAIPGQP